VITGEVNLRRELTVQLRVAGPSGDGLDLAAAIDTGFDGFLTAPLAVVTRLRLQRWYSSNFILGDGSAQRLEVFRASVVWDGQELQIPLVAAEATPLVGMSLLYGHRVGFDAVIGGPVYIEAIPV
jgi:predicted aspartyl protease